MARNTVLSLIGQAVPLAVGVATVPFIVQGLGVDRFGLLSLAWVILGYFGVFDLGLGRATTKYVSEALAQHDNDQVSGVVWTAAVAQTLFGLLGAAVLAGITPLVVHSFLKVPTALSGEASVTFYLLALAVPVLLVSRSFSGALEAAQRFDLVNAVRLVSGSSGYLLPWLGLVLGLGLPAIVAVIVTSRLVVLAAFVTLALRNLPAIARPTVSLRMFGRLFAFGGWVTLSSVLIPIFTYLDRFLIGSVITLSAVAYYAAPYELVTKLLFIPSSFAVVLFPAFSSMASSGLREQLDASVARSTKYLVTAMAPAIAVLVIFAEDILRLWLGNAFANEGATVLRVLSVAVFLNAIGYVPFALIEGVGRPDIVAKYHLVELPVYAGVALILIGALGITGAGLAWCLRMLVTIPIFFALCSRMAAVNARVVWQHGAGRALGVSTVLLTCSVALAFASRWGVVTSALLAGALVSGYLLIVWLVVFDAMEKGFVREGIRGVRRVVFQRGGS